MARRDSHKNQQKKMKQASDAVNTEKDFGNDLGELNQNEKRSKN